MRRQIAGHIRQLQSVVNGSGTTSDFDKIIAALKTTISMEGQLQYFFKSLPEKYSIVFAGAPHGIPVLNQILERDAQLFEADGITDDVKKLHMKDPIEIFLKLDQVRDILKDRVGAYFRFNANPTTEKQFWSDYKQIGCDQAFTYDRYDKLVKLINSHGLPQSILLCYADATGTQLKQGDNVEPVRDIVCLRSNKSIPRGTKLTIRELHYLDNYVEANYNGDAWAFNASQVLKL